jgi:hypothetical protein
MNIAHLSLAALTFELRYPNAFHLWDRSGKIWADAVDRWPSLTLREAAPNQTGFRLENRAEVAVHLDRSFAAVAGRQVKVDNILPFCLFLGEDVPPTLGITTFTRIGFRATFIKRYEKMEDAVTDFFETGMTKKFNGKPFGIDGNVDSPTVSIRFEGKSLGCTATLQVRKRTLKLDVPMIGADEDFDPVTREHLEFVYECDYFTTAPMARGQLKTDRWVNEAMHVIRRDSVLILGG